jgi:2-methylcitrate dehydratase PrpD
VNDPVVMDMRGRVDIVVDDDLPKDAAAVELVLTDGSRLTSEVLHNKGTPAKPMSDDEIEAKFTELAATRIGPDAAHRLADLCWRLDELADVGEIARLAKASEERRRLP